MQVFKTALRIFFKHPIYILIYLCFMSLMAIFIGTSVAPATEGGTFSENVPDVAIIDRDHSDLSEGLSSFLSGRAKIVSVEDSLQSLQDAAAQDYADYILIIPEGFSDDFTSAIERDDTLPSLETVTSYESISAHLMNGLVDEYLQTVSFYVASETSTSLDAAIAATAADMQEESTVEVIQYQDSGPISQQWLLYMQFSGYTSMLAIIACVGTVMSAFNRTEIRRRDLTSPLSSLSMNLQIAAATVVIALICWAWISAVGLIVFGSSLEGANPMIIGIIMLTLLAYCTVPLALGFFLGIITASELVVNSIGNLVGLAFSFLGGLLVSVELMTDFVARIAHFIPTFYYGDALSQAANLTEITPEALAPLFSDIGIILLFAAAIFIVALVAGRLRMQSAEAGGNAAAAVVRL